MADASGMMPEDTSPEAKARVTVGSKVVRLFMPWDWEIKPKGEPKPVKWWTFWRWKFWNAPPPARSPIPSLGNLMPVDPRSWAIMQGTSNWLAKIAVTTNLVLVSVYAATVASQSLLPLAAGFPDWVKIPIIFIFCLVAVATAIVLQFGTDFLIPFSIGLAGEKFRLVPLAAVLLWAGCAFTTIAMKVDVYTGWGRERIAEAAEMATVSASDQRVLDKYSQAVPPPTAASDIVIATATAEITRLEGERTTKDAARTQEDKDLGGRGEKWRALDTDIKALDATLAAERAKLAAATTAKANRLEYDDANSRKQETVHDTTVSEGALLYDSELVVWLRSVGMAAASFLLVLIDFMIRAAIHERAKRSGAAQKGVKTKRQNANTFDGEFSEAPPLDARAIPHLGDVEPEVVAAADTPTRRRAGNAHPDVTGDDQVNGVNGYEGGNGTEEPGKPAGQ